MTNHFSSGQLAVFRHIYGDALAATVTATDPDTFRDRVPAAWLELVLAPGKDTIQALWGLAGPYLPRFVDYMARSIAGAAIIDIAGIPVLVMAFPDWTERGDELEPGFCWMGVPTEQQKIDTFVREVGPIPASLVALWRITSFISFKNGARLCSLDSAASVLAEAPEILPPLNDPNVPSDVYECLKIAVIDDQQVLCLTRKPHGHGRQWNDLFVGYFRRVGALTSASRLQLDDLLADWTFADWA